MTSPNGSAVLLGSRQMRLDLSPRHSKLLQAMAKRYRVSPTTLANELLADAVERAAKEGVMAQVLATIQTLWCS